MRKVSAKTAWYSLLSVSIALILGACIKPVGVEPFLSDPKVQEIIELTKVAVKVDDKTGDRLVGRDRRIEGLKSSKYYMVEKELDADKIPVNPTPPYPLYVTEFELLIPGQLIDDLGYITRIKGGRIIGLTNLHTYTVRAAEPFPNGDLPYTDGGGAVQKPVTGGVINIDGINGTGFLDLSSVLDGTYEAIAVSVDNSPNSWSWYSKTSDDWDSLELEGPNTEVDYVFVKDDFSDFKVLRVKIDPLPTVIDLKAIGGVTPPATGGTPVTRITETAQYTGTVAWSPAISGTFAALTTYTATITLTAKTGYTLKGVAADFFTVAGTSSPATNAADFGVITAEFPATGATPTGNVNFTTITFPINEQASASPGSSSISRGTFNGGNSVVLTLAPPSAGTWSGITWSIGGINDAVTATHVSSGVLTINNSSDFLPILAGTSFEVTVTAVLSGIPYSTFVTITVTN